MPSSALAGLVAPITSRLRGDGILAFEHLHDDRAGGHEGDQIVEERPLAVDAVEAFGLLAGHQDALGGDDAQAGILQHLGDRAGEVAAGGVGLDDREGAFVAMAGTSSVMWGEEVGGSLGARGDAARARLQAASLTQRPRSSCFQ